jgi:hypothetical protein
MLRHILLGALIAWPSVALALGARVVERMCIPASGMPLVGKPAPMPIGCRLRGCLESGAFDWRISIDAKILDGVELRFDQFGAADLKQLQISGHARIDGDRIVLNSGDSRIDRIPDKVRGTVNFVSLSPIFRKDVPVVLKSALSSSGVTPGKGIVDQITIVQHDGLEPVNRFEWNYVFQPCADSSPASGAAYDTLRIEGAALGEKLDVVVMIDARRRTPSGAKECQQGGSVRQDDWVQRFTGVSPLVIPINNLLTSGRCNSEIAVFSGNHRMYLGRAAWTDQPGDVHTIKLQPRIVVPINIWYFKDEDKSRANDEVLVATRLFIGNRVGIELEPKFHRLSEKETEVIKQQKCKAAVAMKKMGRYIVNALNVYYVAEGTDRNCAIVETPGKCETSDKHPRGDGNFTYLGTISAPFTLAHELGHAFGLRPSTCWGHVNNLVDAFGLENVMYADTFEAMLRKRFTLGQVFRMNTQQDKWGGTMLIANGLRSESDQRACRPNSFSKHCPLLNTDLR